MTQADIKINGELVHTPSSLSITYQDLTEANRNAVGKMIKEIIATKMQLSLTFVTINNGEVQRILRLTNNNFFTVEFYNPYDNNFCTKTFYAGDRSLEAYGLNKKGELIFKELKVNLIEQ